MKCVILAGGSGSRLYPVTSAISKQILPIYDKPMIYYPLSTLMLMGVKDILVITTLRDQPLFKNLIGTGVKLGIKISYEIQEEPKGIPQAFILAEKFIRDSKVVLILGDNIKSVLFAAELAVKKMNKLENIILPFPGGIVRSGSKVGSKYKGLIASTNFDYCPNLRSITNSKLNRKINEIIK